MTTTISWHKKGVPQCFEYIRKFRECAEQIGIPYLVVLLPTISGVFRKIPDQLEKEHINFVDYSSIIKDFSPEEFKANHFDAHPAAIVHKRVAALLTADIMHYRGHSP
jgi:hypothetical protein